MRLLQFHEFLTLLNGGAKTQPADDRLSNACLKQAEAIWPILHLNGWNARQRSVETVARCHTSGKLLVHITADWKNCFLVLVVPPGQLKAEAYMLFDIGAEYGDVRFSCPAFGLDQIADEVAIRKYLPRLRDQINAFASLNRGDGTFMQTYAEGEIFRIEHQLVSSSSHYCIEEPVSLDDAINLFLSYAFGSKEWARDFTWVKLEL